ncbi:MAG: glutamate--tRNA ligase [bacterium]
MRFDESPQLGGDYGPYRQSERKSLYREYADQLVASGHAYYAFDTPGELDEIRKRYEREKKTFVYNAGERNSLQNSITLPKDQVDQMISSGAPYVIRFKMPENEKVVMQDLIRGRVEVDSRVLDDKILFKSDGMPTYHLANVVDDHLMQISHVIRGEEWLPSLPLHVMLYRAFGWAEPSFAHLPLLLKPEGNGKLSKRDGDRLGFPVFPLQWTDPKTGDVSRGYREDGYFPEAFINMLALLGWNPGDERELFSMDELIGAFSIERVGKSGSKFDPEKARWFNHQYLMQKSDDEVAALYQPILKKKGITYDPDKITVIVSMVKERVSFIEELWDQTDFFFRAPESYDPVAVKKRWKEPSYEQMEELITILSGIEDFSARTTEETVKSWIAEKEYGMGVVMNAFRLLIVGALKGPHLFDIISILGQEETLNRLDRGLEVLGKKLVSPKS